MQEIAKKNDIKATGSAKDLYNRLLHKSILRSLSCFFSFIFLFKTQYLILQYLIFAYLNYLPYFLE